MKNLMKKLQEFNIISDDRPKSVIRGRDTQHLSGKYTGDNSLRQGTYFDVRNK